MFLTMRSQRWTFFHDCSHVKNSSLAFRQRLSRVSSQQGCEDVASGISLITEDSPWLLNLAFGTCMLLVYSINLFMICSLLSDTKSRNLGSATTIRRLWIILRMYFG